jgi:sec-independent protein translocase protein TatA
MGWNQVRRYAACCPEVSAMLNDLFQPMHLLIIGLIVVVFFGGKKLPELGKGLGEGLKGFKEGLKGVTDDVKNDAHIVTPEPKEPATKA